MANHPLRIAHRGARDETPENTRSAFERALTYPIDGIELDVQLSADGAVIIYHDTTLFRINRRRFKVSGQTKAQLAALDWGKWFDASFTGEPLNTLKETLAAFGPMTKLLVEIKSSPSDQKTGRSQQLTKEVLRLLDEMPRQVPKAHIFILSFDKQVLKIAHQLAPQWRYVLNVPEHQPETIINWPPDETTHLHAIDVRIDRLTEKIAQWAKDNKLRLFTYTCNTERQVNKALRLKVDAILTDRPGWLTGLNIKF